eukprot:8129108-Ditylum_brightwellii.AAC.1
MKAETEATMAKFHLEMQQQLDATIHTIVNDMHNSILASVQAIMDASLAQLSIAGATTAQQLPSTQQNTVTQQGPSSPANTAFGTSSIEQSSAASAASK